MATGVATRGWPASPLAVGLDLQHYILTCDFLQRHRSESYLLSPNDHTWLKVNFYIVKSELVNVLDLSGDYCRKGVYAQSSAAELNDISGEIVYLVDIDRVILYGQLVL
ncbi:hypothetical protein A0H81_00024 [Grifola frondosa]|uniref:Uncharacterized protein n=1 Tax=Grifola frondosa TaxID=5627 RepID=A0A1C7MQB8_GRIFR|nr:hypothetical protein A0H81_00024 [Grifola frondosa]